MKTTLNMILFLLTVVCFSQTTVNTDMCILEGTQITIADTLNILLEGKVMNDGELMLKGDLINNGVLSYTSTSNESSIHFTGNLQQVLGQQNSVFYNVLFNNTKTILKSSIQVDNDANFTMGIVESEPNEGLFYFNELSDHINTSNLSFVDGTVLKKGSLDFSFPIGTDNLYRPAFIDNLAGENLISSCYFFQGSNELYPHNLKEGVIDFIDNQEYWELKRREGDDYAIVTLSRDAATSSAEIMNAALTDLHIVRWDAAKNYWVDEGGIAIEGNDTVKTITNVTNYGVYALGLIRTDQLLPGDVVVYNNLTPNGDGVNDALIIKGIERFTDNVVRVFNRWGTKISEIKGYDNKEKVFKGFASSDATLQSSKPLPSGTYYYSLDYTTSGKHVKKINYLFINGK